MKEVIRTPIERINPEETVKNILRWAGNVTRLINKLVDTIPDDSTATDVAGVVSDLNDLQDVLRDLDAQ